MSLIATAKGGDFEIAPEGVHAARCYRIIDLGTQQTEWQGKVKRAHKVMLAWELLGDERMQDGQPFSIAKRYTVSTHEKAQMRKDLQAWRGRPFTIEEQDAFQLVNVLGAYCLLNVVHEAKDDKTYANFASIMPLPKGMPKPAAVNPTQVFDLDDRDMAMYATFSDKLKETIAKAEEWLPQRSEVDKAAHDMPDDVPWDTGNHAQQLAEIDVPF